MAAPFDFDAHPVRWGSNSLKWSATAQIRDAEWPPMAMGTSDMDFRAPPVAVEAGMRLLRDGALGYRADTGSFRGAVANWMAERHDWHIDPEAVLPVCGTLNGAALALDTLTDPGAGVLIFEPVYGYFRILIEGMRRVPVAIRLSETDGRYRLPDTLESSGLPDGVQAILFCAPHNPVGRVWTEAEIDRMLAFARAHSLLVISDEVHLDLVYPGERHIPVARRAGTGDRVVTVAGPGKTFNLAGLALSNAIVPDPGLRAPIEDRARALLVETATPATAMAEAAYGAEGAAWLAALLLHLDKNRRMLHDAVNRLPGMRMQIPEATYLAWIRLSEDPARGAEMARVLRERGGIDHKPGGYFGTGQDGHVRINFATSRANLLDAIGRMETLFGS
jgi:cystathionine beta-lyase